MLKSKTIRIIAIILAVVTIIGVTSTLFGSLKPKSTGGGKVEENKPEHVHEFESMYTVDSTCLEQGYDILECKTCSEQQTKELPFLKHDLNADFVCNLCEQQFVQFAAEPNDDGKSCYLYGADDGQSDIAYIPAVYEGKTVESVSFDSSYLSRLREIYVEEGVKYVNDVSVTTVEKIYLPNSICFDRTKMPAMFSGCDNPGTKIYFASEELYQEAILSGDLEKCKFKSYVYSENKPTLETPGYFWHGDYNSMLSIVEYENTETFDVTMRCSSYVSFKYSTNESDEFGNFGSPTSTLETSAWYVDLIYTASDETTQMSITVSVEGEVLFVKNVKPGIPVRLWIDRACDITLGTT